MAHTTKVTLPTPAFVLIKLYVKSIHPNIAYANPCISTLRVASRSGSRLIRYERQLTKVRRLAHEGLEAASCQIEPGEKNRDEPQRPCPTTLGSRKGHLNLSRLILTSNQTHRISVEKRPIGHPSLSNGSDICQEAG